MRIEEGGNRSILGNIVVTGLKVYEYMNQLIRIE